MGSKQTHSLETLGFHLCFYKIPLHQTTERGNGGGGGGGGGGEERSVGKARKKADCNF